MKNQKIFKKQKKEKEKCFTIIELLVALGVFVFIVISALSIYTIAVQRYFQAQKIQVVNEELRYAMEIIAKDIENSYIVAFGDGNTLYLDHLPEGDFSDSEVESKNPGTDCLDGDGNLNQKDDCLQYKFEGELIKSRTIYDDNGTGGYDFVPLTSSRIEIKDFRFYIDSEISGTNKEQKNPKVTILIKAQAANDNEGFSDVTLQTTITQRAFSMEFNNYYKGNLSP